LKHDIIRLNDAAKRLNSPDTFVQYAKVKREIDAKAKRLGAIQDERKKSRIITWSQSAAFFVKYFLPLVPIAVWWNTPIFLLPTQTGLPTEISVTWWTLLCNVVSYRLVSLASN